ncbi:hypothetical protein PR202_gb13437 [Eleusine coracana subsp. coracana]|uniref:Uncharacterized protein n=1 Tax=Eleusine coracana subsp. coracana TaxID=191504 RepID=A0AAV5EU37_ELECO|nr:hypothetical protein PR202_gb13437 [Eleusine coracana subsp. coracana]
MEALTCLLQKLAELVAGEYCLQTEVKGGIIFLKAELEHMKAALEKISKTPIDQLDKQEKIWARDVRDLSYEIEDKIDTFLVRCKGNKAPVQEHGLKKVIGKSLDLLMQPRIRRKIATDIRHIKSRVKEVSERRGRYKIDNDVVKSATYDPRLFTRYMKETELIGVDQARDEVIKILMQCNEVSKTEDKILSIVGFGGLGKTTLANMVFEKLRVQFDCSASISVSQTPDMEKLFKDMFYKLAKRCNESIDLIDELREFLHKKRLLENIYHSVSDNALLTMVGSKM